MDRQSRLIADLSKVVQGDPFWESYIGESPSVAACRYSLHLAVMIEPYLRFVLDGSKTVESRFSVNRCAPYDRVKKGDVVLFKKPGGPIVGLSRVAETWFYRLDPDSWRDIKDEFSSALAVQDASFWEQRQKASFASLMLLRDVRPIDPVSFEKRDRRGWVVLNQPGPNSSLPLVKPL
jgi:hypothetical protein